MKIQVKKIDTSAEDIIINFTSEYGAAEAFWGTKPIPKANTEYDVELDITDELVWGKDVKASNDKKFSINMKQDDIYITGIIEKIYKDGMADFRLGKNLIQIELLGKNAPIGIYVTIKTSSIELYEANK
ncbi:MAG: hypothetical protein A2Y23_15520 [Clostridiales bacterium GWB2_37_7]|nr:MAG: hypothetical protein A2Y23_15520 [Clostridiales bacterium GWB2_37_7]